MDDNHDDVSQWSMIYGSNIQNDQDELNQFNCIQLNVHISFCSTEFQEFPKK